jgi:hypothetical protein
MDPHAGKTIGDWPEHPSHMSLFLDPSIAATSLVYVSHDHINHIDSFEFALYSYTASLVNRSKL